MYLCVVQFQMGELEILKQLIMCIPDQEVSVLLRLALLQRPVLSTFDTTPLHNPEKQQHSH